MHSSPKPSPTRNPVINSQHSPADEETPTAETDRSESLREILDGPIDTKLHLIQHHAKMACLLTEEVNP